MRFTLYILSLCLLGCTEIFEGEFSNAGPERIVITGGITNIDVPEIRIYTSVPFGEGSNSPRPIGDAHVWIQGNITNVDDRNKSALGMFFAAGVTTAQLNLNRSGISAQFTPTRFANDCRLVNNSTDEAPKGYISSRQNQCFNYYNSLVGSGWHECDQCYDFVANSWSKCPE